MHYKPSYLPYNDKARDLVKSIADQLGLSMNQKHEIVIASMLAVAKAADGEGFAWIVGNENHNLKFFSQYPNVGVKVINKVRSLLMEHGFIWDLDKINAEHYDNQIMDIFGVDTDELAKMMGFAAHTKLLKPASRIKATVNGLDEAIFVEANLPLVQVNEAETWEGRLQRKSQGKQRQRMGISKVKSTFRSEYSKAVRPLKEMNAYWLQHPLHNPIQKEYYAAAAILVQANKAQEGLMMLV